MQSVSITSSEAARAVEITGLTTQIAYGAGATGWLTATLIGPTTPTTLDLSAQVGGLPSGTYTATVTVSSSQAGVASIAIPVTLTVTGIQPVDCSRSNTAPNFPPAQARPVEPNPPFFTGTTGAFFLAWNLGTQAQTIRVEWDMRSVPDAITICFRGQELFDSGGPVSGLGSFEFAYPGSPGTNPNDPAQSIYLYLSIQADDPGTLWDARVIGTYVPPSYTPPPSFSLTPLNRLLIQASPRERQAIERARQSPSASAPRALPKGER
jgi:hypothetical protein